MAASSASVTVSVSPTSAAAAAMPMHGKRYIISLDSSEYSHYALNWALDNVFTSKDHVTLMHVLESSLLVDAHTAWADPIAKVGKSAEASAVRLLKTYGQECLHRHITPHLVLLKGDLKGCLEDYVTQEMPDAFLIASRGLGSVKRFFLGSLSDYCVNHLPVTVIVVRESPDYKEKVAQAKAQAVPHASANDQQVKTVVQPPRSADAAPSSAPSGPNPLTAS